MRQRAASHPAPVSITDARQPCLLGDAACPGILPPDGNDEARSPAWQPLPHPLLRAHNARIWAALGLIGLALTSAHRRVFC